MTDLDAQIFRVVHDALSGAPWMIKIMIALSALGSGWVLIGALPLLLFKRTQLWAGSLIATLGITALAVNGAKQVFTRVRPYRCLEGVKCFALTPPTDYSFPSGHSAGSFACAVFIATVLVWDRTSRTQLRWGGAMAAIFVAIWIGLSRIALGVHFPGDVAVGAVLGTLVGHVGGRLYLRRKATEAPSALA